MARSLVIVPAIIVAASASTAPAGAQFFDDRYPFERPRVQRDFFPFSIFGDRGSYDPYRSHNRHNPNPRQTQPIESTKPPPTRKLETPPSSTVIVIGDSLADWLSYGLEETFADAPDIGIVRKVRPTSGLVRYEPRSDTPEWSQAVKDVLAAEKPKAIVVMLGLEDRQSLRDRAPTRVGSQRNGEQGQASQAPQNLVPRQGPPPPSSSESEQQSTAVAQRPVQSASYEFRSDKWAELYGKRIDDMIAALKTKGVPVLWVGLPAIRGTRSTSDMSYLNELYRAHAEKASITYVDIWGGFVDDQGVFALQGPDFEGQIRRLRSFDGVYFTKAGAEKLGHYVEHELRHAMSSWPLPVVLPGPEELRAAKPGAMPAEVGPVVPLSAIGGGEGGDLLGGGSDPAQGASDPVARRVLSRGDALAAPRGRADDFSWPRANTDSNAMTDKEPLPAVSTPSAPLAKGPLGKNDVKKPADAKSQAVPDAAPARARRSRADLDGAAPRPPLPVGSAAGNAR